jgi:hypothetical protein
MSQSEPPFDPASHDAPLLHLVRHGLQHLAGTTLRERVVRLRYRRRKSQLTNPSAAVTTNDECNEQSEEPARS